MRTTIVVGMLLLFLTGTIISLTLEQQYLGTSTVDTLFTLMRPDFASFSNPLTAIGGFFILVWNWIQALWDVLTWNYIFFTGYWEILRYVGWCISIGVVVSLILAVRGVGSS